MASTNQGDSPNNTAQQEDSGYITRSEFFNCFRELVDSMKQPLQDNTVTHINPLHSTPTRPFHEELNVIEDHERRGFGGDATLPNSVRQPAVGAFSPRSSRQELKGPGMKMPNYDGSGDIDVFFIPFDRLADRFGWSDIEKVDRLFQCLQGPALNFLCGLPADVLNSYAYIKVRLVRRFTNMDQPASLRRQLSDMRQRAGQSNEEFAEEVNKLVIRAYPGISMEMLEQLGAEHFLKGYRNSKIAYEVMNRVPRTLNESLSYVTTAEQNFRATIGRDQDRREFKTTRRVNWADMQDDCHALDDPNSEGEKINRVHTQQMRPTYVTVSQLDERLKKIENMLARLSTTETEKVYSNRSPSPSPSRRQEGRNDCFNCGQRGHFARQCPNKKEILHTSPYNKVEEEQKAIFEITHVETKGISVPIRINDVTTKAVVDTGADATVISEDVARDACLDYKAGKKCKLLNAANNAEMVAYEGVTATLQIGKQTWNWPVYVAPIRGGVLLGIDFLQGSDAKILTRQGDIIFGDQLVFGHVKTDSKMKGYLCPNLETTKNDTFGVTKAHDPAIHPLRNNKVTCVIHNDKLTHYQAEDVPNLVNRLRNEILVTREDADEDLNNPIEPGRDVSIGDETIMDEEIVDPVHPSGSLRTPLVDEESTNGVAGPTNSLSGEIDRDRTQPLPKLFTRRGRPVKRPKRLEY